MYIVESDSDQSDLFVAAILDYAVRNKNIWIYLSCYVDINYFTFPKKEKKGKENIF